MSFRFPGSSKGRAPTQELIRNLDPNILENHEIFPNGQLLTSNIFKNREKTTKAYYVNFQVNKDGNLLPKESSEVMLAAIDYYTSKNCITVSKSQELLLSKNLYDYLNQIRDILPTLSSGPPLLITQQLPSAPPLPSTQQLLSAPPLSSAQQQPSAPPLPSAPQGAITFHNPLLDPIQNTRQIQQQFRKNTGSV